MSNLETCALLVRLYAEWRNYFGSTDMDYEEAIAKAIAALTKDGETSDRH